MAVVFIAAIIFFLFKKSKGATLPTIIPDDKPREVVKVDGTKVTVQGNVLVAKPYTSLGGTADKAYTDANYGKAIQVPSGKIIPGNTLISASSNPGNIYFYQHGLKNLVTGGIGGKGYNKYVEWGTIKAGTKPVVLSDSDFNAIPTDKDVFNG